MYVFFSSSTKRWKVLTDLLAEGNERGLTVKSLSETRWSARYDAITALMSGYDKIYEALVTLASDDSQKPETKVEAQGLTKSIQTLETSLLTVIWQKILERFHKTTIILQGASVDLNSATALLKGLVVFIQSLRTRFDIFEQRAKSNSACVDYYKSSRIRSGNPKYGIYPEDTSISSRNKFLNSTFFVVIDKLEAELMFRLKAYQDVSNRFGFLKNLASTSLDEIRYSTHQLVTYYLNDLEDSVVEEFCQFVSFLESRNENFMVNSDHKVSIECQMFTFLSKNNLQDIFPNVYITLQLYLCMMISNCSGERSFSKLSLIKNKMRSSMLQDRLNMLTLMSIEHELLDKIDFSDVIRDFADKKLRKKYCNRI